jgi:phosphoglycolate phosphatase-like HAD superfamily hydrolase
MHPVGVLWGFRQREELEQSGAETVISAPQEALNLLA